MNFQVKEAAQKLNLSPHTIRYYTDLGLVPNMSRDAYGNRVFDEMSLNWLKTAHYLHSSGLPLAEVKHYFALCQQGTETLQERYQLLSALQCKAEAEVVEAQKRADCIARKVAHFQDIMDGKCVDDCNPLNW